MEQELEVLTDPMRKEVAAVRKRIDMVNRDLKSMGQVCQKKVLSLNCLFFPCLLFLSFFHGFFFFGAGKQEKEYKEALESFNEKNNEKAQLTATLMEVTFTLLFKFKILPLIIENKRIHDSKNLLQLLNESEKQRMGKLEKLNKIIESIR